LNWRQTAIDAEKAKRESIKAQYDSLKNQVNPHFLFNSLNALTNLVYQDQDKAAKFIKQLSEVYRYVLESRDKEVVTINEELKSLESYIFLQQIRFGDKLNVQIDIPQRDGRVAPLALQMLFENAIKHNVISEEYPLTIHIYRKEDNLIVENTLKRKHILPEDSSGLGLENIKKRYEFLSDKKVAVEETNLKFKVTLPILPIQ
jgi:LytS/YehU family sensor histidine kinase